MINVSILKYPSSTSRWKLIASYLELRKAVFIERIGWDLNALEKIEYEQYDVIGVATYIIVHEDDKVVAGARLLRCNTEFGHNKMVYSYMIRDAFLGRIELNRDICWEEPPFDSKTWELSRLLSVKHDAIHTKAIVDAANAFIKINGGNRCLFLGWPAFLRMARLYGYKPRRLGKITTDNLESYLPFECPVN